MLVPASRSQGKKGGEMKISFGMFSQNRKEADMNSGGDGISLVVPLTQDCAWPLNHTYTYTSSSTATTPGYCRHRAAMHSNSQWVKTFPVGLWGVLTTISFVFEEKAAAKSVSLNDHCGGFKKTVTGVAPARRIMGAYES